MEVFLWVDVEVFLIEELGVFETGDGFVFCRLGVFREVFGLERWMIDDVFSVFEDSIICCGYIVFGKVLYVFKDFLVVVIVYCKYYSFITLGRG